MNIANPFAYCGCISPYTHAHATTLLHPCWECRYSTSTVTWKPGRTDVHYCRTTTVPSKGHVILVLVESTIRVITTKVIHFNAMCAACTLLTPIHVMCMASGHLSVDCILARNLRLRYINKYKKNKIWRKSRDGSSKKHRNKSSSDGKLVLGDMNSTSSFKSSLLDYVNAM